MVEMIPTSCCSTYFLHSRNKALADSEQEGSDDCEEEWTYPEKKRMCVCVCVCVCACLYVYVWVGAVCVHVCVPMCMYLICDT